MEITSKELKEKINRNEKVVVDFWASFCGPCKMMKPLFESVSNTLITQSSDVQFYTFDIEQDREFVQSLGIRGVPTIKAFNEGKEVFTKVGIMRENELMDLAKNVLHG